MPVLLTTEEEREAWMTAPADAALKLQRPLSDGALQIVARGETRCRLAMKRSRQWRSVSA
jgi:putative SOS response-associated peptidase YedK